MKRRTSQWYATPLLVAVSAVVVTACSSTSSSSGSSSGGSGSADVTTPTTITYALWDTSQQPAYQACADAFQKKTGITVKIQQTNYSSYWTSLATDFVAGTGPDVFNDVTSNYPDFAIQGQIVDLTPLIAKDKVDLSAYLPVTLQNWKMDGKYWGLPKDIDTVGLAYDAKAVGSSAASLSKLTWNPQDGGSFGQLVKKLTLDKSGHNGLDPAFDKNAVTRYGLIAPSVTDISGHTSWGNFVLSNGQELLTPNPFGHTWNFGEAPVVDTIAWYQKMIDGGFIQKPSLNSSLSSSSLFDAGKIAMATDGSWNAGVYSKGKASVKWAEFPTGPNGLKAYTNSLADSISANSKHQNQAWEWVKYLGTPECQDVVASFGVVFPALKASNAKALSAYAKNGVDMAPILKTLTLQGATVALPIALKYAQVEQAGDAAIQNILLNGADPQTTLAKLSKQVGSLYQ